MLEIVAKPKQHLQFHEQAGVHRKKEEGDKNKQNKRGKYRPDIFHTVKVLKYSVLLLLHAAWFHKVL